ncbi:hypothetical protein TNCV_1296811 [Trichonephila clavipes]|uniref:Uncharacterized protein n=1 Tax=Trichonephila clavipes TaxID=2585209 RepID=A0A8X6SLY7_TRICX|nr:hypothetical protein TNCV_1296811 [Trichonephila clavipes]
MGKTTYLSPFEKWLIVGVRLAGASISKTANMAKFSKEAISGIFKSWNQKPLSSRKSNCDLTQFSKSVTASSRRILWKNRDSVSVLSCASTTGVASSVMNT